MSTQIIVGPNNNVEVNILPQPNVQVVVSNVAIGTTPTTYGNSNVANFLPTFTGNVSAEYFIGNGSLLTGIASNYGNTEVAEFLPVYGGAVASPQINFNAGGGDERGYINGTPNNDPYIGEPSQINLVTVSNKRLSWDNNSNLTLRTSTTAKGGNVIATNFYGNLRGNIVGNTSVTGNISATNFIGNLTGTATIATTATTAGVANSVAGPNVSGQVGNAIMAGTVYASNQPNIKTVGSLVGLNVIGSITVSGGPGTPSIVNAVDFVGSGQQLSNITGANVNGQVGNALVAGRVYTNAQPNITSLGTLTSLSISGPVTGNIIPSSNVTFNLGNSTNRFKDLYLSGTTIFLGTANISASGNALVTSGSNVNGELNVTGNATINGNLAVAGNLTYINVTSLNVQDPLIELGGGPNGSALTTNDGMDRGEILQYYTTQPVSAYSGWKNNAGEFQFGSNVSVSNNIVTVNTYGNVRANVFIGNLQGIADFATVANSVAGSNVIGEVANAAYATSAGTATTAGVANSVAGANVVGEVANAAYATNAGLATFATTANSVAGSNVVGEVANATYATNAGSATTATNATTATTANSVAGANVSGTVANATFAETANIAYNLDGSLINNLNTNGKLIVGAPYGAAQLDLTLGASINAFRGLSGPNGGIQLNTSSNNTTENTWTFGYNGNLTLPGNTFAVNYANGSPVTIGNATNANYANYAGNAFSITGSNVSGEVSFAAVANSVAGANVVGEVSFAAVANSVAGANVSGTVANATYATNAGSATTADSATTAGTVTTAAQPNITSVGTLTSLDVTGNISASFFIGNGSALTGVTTSIGGSNTQLQFNNDGSLGGISTVTWNGSNLALGAISNVKITGGSSGQVISTDGTGNLSFVDQSGGGGGGSSGFENTFLMMGA